MIHGSPVWDCFFPDEPHHIYAYHDAVRGRLAPHSTVLDLGCGANADFDDLRKSGHVVWGTDFQRHPHLVAPDWFRLLPEDGTIPFPDATFDVVTAVCVLEHVQRPRAFLGEVRRVLRPGGLFLGHSIHGHHYVTFVKRLLHLVPHRATQWLVQTLYGRAPHDTFPTCYRLNTEAQIERHCRHAGLSPVQMRRYADPGYFSFHPWAMNAAIVVDWAVERLFGCGRIYFSVTLQRPGAAGAGQAGKAA